MNFPLSSLRFDVPTLIHGGGSRAGLPQIVRELGGSRVLLVTDEGVVARGGAQEIVAILEGAGLAVAVFEGVQPDPTDENVAAGVAALQAHRGDILVALGGGSPMDCAKVIAIRAANPAPLSDFMGLHKISNFGLPLIAVPTTAGTGSEATKVAVITDSKRHVKMMMLAAPLLPRVAVVDYELSLSMPKNLTAAVGVDTLTHGIEAFVSRKANVFTDALALRCVELCARHLQTAWREPDNCAAREGMMLAATLGGMAFSNASVALVHGMSRPIGAIFGLPHGLSNAVLLPTVTRFSLAGAPARYAILARVARCANVGDDDATAGEKLLGWLENLNRALEIPPLGECRGATRDAFESNVEKMASDALASGSPANNPRVPDEREIVGLYRQAWGNTID